MTLAPKKKYSMLFGVTSNDNDRICWYNSWFIRWTHINHKMNDNILVNFWWSQCMSGLNWLRLINIRPSRKKTFFSFSHQILFFFFFQMGWGVSCVDTTLNKSFYKLGKIIGRHPSYFIIIPTLLTIIFITG